MSLLRALLLTFLLATAASASEPSWITFAPSETVHLLERENRAADECPSCKPGVPCECRSRILRPVQRTIRLYRSADSNALLKESIRLRIRPGKGLETVYVTGEKELPLAPDYTSGDWGYGSYHLFTVAERKGGRVRLPKRPFPGPVWIDLKEAFPGVPEADLFERMRLEQVYVVPKLGDVVFTKFGKDEVEFRDEVPADMPCGEEEKTPRRPGKVRRAPRSALFDAEGHLVVSPKYPRGC